MNVAFITEWETEGTVGAPIYLRIAEKQGFKSVEEARAELASIARRLSRAGCDVSRSNDGMELFITNESDRATAAYRIT